MIGAILFGGLLVGLIYALSRSGKTLKGIVISDQAIVYMKNKSQYIPMNNTLEKDYKLTIYKDVGDYYKIDCDEIYVNKNDVKLV